MNVAFTGGNDGSSPPWNGVRIPASYRLDSNGVAAGSNASNICGPAWVAASTLEDQTGTHGILICWLDVCGLKRELAVTRDELHGYASGLPQNLARGGLRIVPGEERKLLKYFADFEIADLAHLQSVSQLGWIEHQDGALAYMLPQPSGLVAATGHRPVIYQPECHSVSTQTVYQQGTLQDWNCHVLAACRRNPLLLFPVLLALSGPLTRFADVENGGFHYYGRSSFGKTTAAQAAASVWGNGADPAEAPEHAYMQKWHSTANAFEALLSAHNDNILVLDEIGTCDAKDFGAVVYNMSSGSGKNTLHRDRSMRKPRKWRTVYFSTGEISALAKIQAEGKSARAGQMLRLIDVPVDGGIVTDCSDIEIGAFVDRLKGHCARYFGSAGPELIRALVAEYGNTQRLGGTIKAMLDASCARLAPADPTAETRRAIKRFAFVEVAGKLAVSLGIIECTIAEVEASTRSAVRAWIANAASVPDRVRGVLNVAEFISRHESRFHKLGDANVPLPRDRVGYMGWDNATRSAAYWFTPDGFREACGDRDSLDTARELKRLGLLVAREPDRLTDKRDVLGTRQRFYVVKPDVLEFEPPTVDLKLRAGTTGATGAIAE